MASCSQKNNCRFKTKLAKEAHGEIETEHPGYLLAQDTYYVGNIKGVGRIYQQTVIDTYSRVAFAKLYTDKTAITSADILNDQVVPFFNEQQISVLRVLTDRGTEYCGLVENHAYQLYLAVEDIDHSKTKARHPQTNGICERLHKTMKDEFYSVAFRKKYTTLSRSYKQTLMNGCVNITNFVRIPEGIAMEKLQCKHSWLAKYIALEKNCSILKEKSDNCCDLTAIVR